MKIQFLTVGQVLEIHDLFLNEYGGMPGVRDQGLLKSAVEMPRMIVFGEDIHPSLFEKAAARAIA